MSGDLGGDGAGRPAGAQERPFEGVTVRIGTQASQSADAFMAMAPEFTEETGITLEVDDISFGVMYEKLKIGFIGLHPDPELIDSRDDEIDRVRSTSSSSTGTMSGVCRPAGAMEHAVDRDHGIVGRRGREVDLDMAVRALPRIERRCLIEELLGGAVGSVRTSL